MPHLSPLTSHLSPRPSAWLHNPALSLWLSVDPLSDKYPGVSPYVYCADNPVRYFDPNGEDEWEVNKSGHIKHVEGSEGKPDMLFAVKGFGKDRFRKRCDENGMAVNSDVMNGLMNSQTEKTTNYSIVDHRDEMKDLFNYLADNTNVEWVSFGFSAQDILRNADGSPIFENGGVVFKDVQIDVLRTEHRRTECSAVQSFNNAARLDYFKHSHPAFYFDLNFALNPMMISGNKTPIGGDDYDGDYGHKRKCMQAGASCDFVLRWKGHEIKY